MTAGGGAVIAAVAAARARRVRDVMDAFRLADATAPDRARSLDEIGITAPAEVAMLSEAGIVVQDPRTGAWWLSEHAYVAHRDQQPKKAIRVLLVFIAIALVIVAAGMLALMKSAR
jgi:hypothetical protein